MFTENSTFQRATIRKYILRDELIPYQCSQCGQEPFWNGRPLTLQIEHINGVNNDHRLENLTFLCPNCHTQTDTYAGRNIKYPPKEPQLCVICNEPKRHNAGKAHTNCRNVTKIDWPDSESLQKMVDESNYCAVARQLGVSDVSVHKRLKRYPA